MWKSIVVADAKPLIVLVVARTCFKSMYAVEFAAISSKLPSQTRDHPYVRVPRLAPTISLRVVRRAM
jgi:hypothetical protein